MAEDRNGTDGGPRATLADVLYGDRTPGVEAEKDWVRLVRAVAAGDQVALHALYERAHRIVYTLAVRITGSRETAEEVTLDVFHDVWRRASGYDPANGTVLGWIMNQARSRAIDRLRFEQRKKRVEPHGEFRILETYMGASDEAIEQKQDGLSLRHAVRALSAGERKAIEAAFFFDMSHAEVAARLNEPLGTIKTRIRSGLQKLRQVLGPQAKKQ